MQVVIASIVLPYPLTSGGAQGLFNMIDSMRHDHQLTLIFPQNGGNTLRAMRQLQTLWPNVDLRPYPYWRQLLHPRFLIDKARRAFGLRFRADDPHFRVMRILKPYGYYMTSDFGRFIRRIIEQKRPDLFQSEFYPYLPITSLLPAGLPRLFVHHELRSVRNERMLQGIIDSANYRLSDNELKLKQQVEQQELDLLNQYDAVITLTEVDRSSLKQRGVRVPIFTSPLSVNTPVIKPQPWNGKLLFLGGFEHLPNQEGLRWLLNEVLPMMDKVSTPLSIVGSGWNEPWFDALNTSGIPLKLHGYVEDLLSVAQGSIMVVPILSGSGMRMKLLEAAALGTPVITTSVGCEGLRLRHLEHCLIADTPAEFASAIARLTQDEALRSRLAEALQRHFEQHYSPQAMAHLREEVWQSVISTRS